MLAGPPPLLSAAGDAEFARLRERRDAHAAPRWLSSFHSRKYVQRQPLAPSVFLRRYLILALSLPNAHGGLRSP